MGSTVESIQTDPIRLALKTVEPDEKMRGLAWLTTEAFHLDTEEGPSMSYWLGTNALLIT